MSRLRRFKAAFAHAFAVEAPVEEMGREDRELVERLARQVVARRMSVAALLILEAGRPLNFIGSQLLVFLGPLLTFVFSPAEYERFTRLLERRDSVDLLIEGIIKEENKGRQLSGEGAREHV